MNTKELLWGVDLGGTKIELVVLQTGLALNPIWRSRIPTEANLGYDHILNQIEEIIAIASKELGITPDQIGMGTPGVAVPSTGLMKNCNTLVLNGKPLQKDIESLTGIPFKIANDANCFALAEAKFGAVQDQMPNAEIVFGVIMGTGVGGGLVIHGNVINGLHGISGEWGHHYLVPDGHACYCGRKGCTEQYISGPATEAYYKELSGKSLKMELIVERAKNGDDIYAVKTIDRLCLLFARAISNVINILDPDAIILGGGLGNIDALYEKGVDQIKQHIFNDRVDTLFLKPKLGDSAGVFGAALL